MKNKNYLMLARRTVGLKTNVGKETVKIVGCFGLKAEIKKTFVQNGCKWYLVLNPTHTNAGEYKYIVCHETGFAISFGNTQKGLLQEAKELLERCGHKVETCQNNTKELYDSIKISVLSM
ncbi:hypothetical protein [Bacillus thuringiensis]|uniref:hypothetical protein n=1 Tax=Bacillus thuringiensis TaxID=1428 RepID=UPI000BFE6BB1|nr:hypothetical protein [Bacillus thuringiensis]PGT89842.1 hypothetical protein COD17_08825 [Bacillus thuringiensis]